MAAFVISFFSGIGVFAACSNIAPNTKAVWLTLGSFNFPGNLLIAITIAIVVFLKIKD